MVPYCSNTIMEQPACLPPHRSLRVKKITSALKYTAKKADWNGISRNRIPCTCATSTSPPRFCVLEPVLFPRWPNTIQEHRADTPKGTSKHLATSTGILH